MGEIDTNREVTRDDRGGELLVRVGYHLGSVKRWTEYPMVQHPDVRAAAKEGPGVWVQALPPHLGALRDFLLAEAPADVEAWRAGLLRLLPEP